MARKPTYEQLEQRVKELEKGAIERKRVEEALRESEEKYRLLAESLLDIVYEFDLEGKFIYVNEAGTRMFGYSKDEILSDLRVEDIIVEEDKVVSRKSIDDILKGKTTVGERTFIRKDGTTFIGEIHSGPIYKGKDVVGVRGVLRDITDRKHVEEALRESEEKYRDLVERANDGIAIVQDTLLKYVNPRLAEITGYTVNEITGTPFTDYVHPDELPRVIDYYKRRMAGENVPSTYETAVRHRNGTKIDVQFNASIIHYQEKPAAFAIVRDMSERNRLEAQLRQAQKLKAIGTFASGIAHNFNNLLMAIMGNTSVMLSETDTTNPNYARLKDIEKAVQSGSRLTGQLLGYARKGGYEIRPISLNQLVEETSDTFGMTKKEIRVHRELAQDLSGIEAEQGQIEQVLLNLYVNASDAMPGGGDLFLKTANITHEHMRGKPYEAKPGNYVVLTVRDTGVGMDKKTMDRIFDPFFTTKEVGRGSGLGLASVYGIIKSHGGYINVESKKGHGTTFSLYLPASEKKIIREKEKPAQVLMGTGTVLLVDDEDIVLAAGERVLKALGYKVLSARSGREAIELCKANKDEIDMVLLDMIMPEMGGGETYDQMKKINPNIKVLLSSGYSIDGEATEILERGCDSFIEKPFNMKQLSRSIREILDKK